MNMQRDWTVWLSILLLVIAGLIGNSYDQVPRPGDPGAALYIFSMILAILGTGRAMLLWFQTLRHVLKQPSCFSRSRWLVLHIVFAPVAPYLYYLVRTLPDDDTGRNADIEPGSEENTSC
jgi:drug/metabolite transporter (DMT)-like permease